MGDGRYRPSRVARPPLGLLLLALPAVGGPYWRTFLVPMCVIGLGMAVTVAPLTTTVLNAVAPSQTDMASGINNAYGPIRRRAWPALKSLEVAIARGQAVSTRPAAKDVFAICSIIGKVTLENDSRRRGGLPR